MKLRLSDLDPPERIAAEDLVPPPRFDAATFASYDPQHPSQRDARDALQAFASHVARPQRTRFRLFRRKATTGRGMYLDGGFGVGKTHLLAATFHVADVGDKRYLSFQELVYLIGVLGMDGARAAFADCRLLCIDEFELDDPGNTLIVKSFLTPYFGAGGHVATTSNTPPGAQGMGRFNAEDFQREIQSIAARFEVVPVGGPDYRERLARGRLLRHDELEERWERANGRGRAQGRRSVHEQHQTDVGAPEGGTARGGAEGAARHVRASFEELESFLGSVHPVRYRGTLEQVDSFYLSGVRTIQGQGDALRFVHFIDKLYDLEVGLVASGEIRLEELFDARYRRSAFQKKHERCLSRLAELLGAQAPAPAAP